MTAHATHEMHENSLRTYNQTEVKRKSRAQLVLEAFKRSDDPLTDRGVMTLCGYTEPNQVRPRITELLGRGELVECGSVLDEVGGRTVRVCRYRKFGEVA